MFITMLLCAADFNRSEVIGAIHEKCALETDVENLSDETLARLKNLICDQGIGHELAKNILENIARHHLTELIVKNILDFIELDKSATPLRRCFQFIQATFALKDLSEDKVVGVMNDTKELSAFYNKDFDALLRAVAKAKSENADDVIEYAKDLSRWVAEQDDKKFGASYITPVIYELLKIPSGYREKAVSLVKMSKSKYRLGALMYMPIIVENKSYLK